jgi:hypothetical protein
MTWPAHGWKPPAKCGTDAGYYRHRKVLGEPACEDCKAAHNDATKRRNARARRYGDIYAYSGRAA